MSRHLRQRRAIESQAANAAAGLRPTARKDCTFAQEVRDATGERRRFVREEKSAST
jgi:hypothetical protein